MQALKNVFEKTKSEVRISLDSAIPTDREVW